MSWYDKGIYKQPKKELTQEEMDVLSRYEAIPLLDGSLENEGDSFAWPLVDWWSRHQDQAMSGQPETPPQEGFAWYWVDNMYNLAGIGGWLEVDLVNRKQGKFNFRCMS
jgi:hypothetical protein